MFSKLIGSERIELESKSIQYLRKLADAIGVDSPTLLGKEELIDEILMALMGGTIEKKKETRGRPKKEFGSKIFSGELDKSEEAVVQYDYVVPRGIGVGVFSSGVGDEEQRRKRRNQLYDKYINYYENQINAGKKTSKVLDGQFSYGIHFGDDLKKYMVGDVEELLSDDKYEIKYGYAYVEDGCCYILKNGFNSIDKIKIEDFSVVSKENIMTGDEIHYYLSDNDEPVLLMVNGIDVGDVENRKTFAEYKIGYPNSRFKAINIIDVIAPISCGSRNVLVGERELTNFIGLRILSGVSKKEKLTYIYVVSVDLSEEELLLFKGITDVVLNLSSKKESGAEMFKLSIFLERIKRLAELGYDVILYVDSYQLLKKFSDNGNFSLTAKDIFELGSKLKESGSITSIISGDANGLKEVENVISNKIVLQNEKDCILCVADCETLFVDKFLSAGEIDVLGRLKTSWNDLPLSDKKELINKYE